MAEIIVAVESLAIQRSLTFLEVRYRELREIGEKRFESWEKEKGEAQQAVEELRKQLEAKEGERLNAVRQRQAAEKELDVRSKEREEAQQRVEELKKQLEAKGSELQEVANERDARTKEKGEAQQQVEELKKHISSKNVELS